MSKPRFLVTGCAGFIGSHMLAKLLDTHYVVVGVDDFSTGKEENIAPFAGQFEFIEGTLCDPAVAARAVAGVERIIHLATVPSVSRSVETPLESVHASTVATVTLFEAARRADVKRIVQASSSSVYGDVPQEVKSETLTPNPMSPYAVAKLSQEYYGRVFAKCYGLDTVSIRYFNVFGPGQNPESKYAAVIPKFITMMLRGEQPTIFGDGNQSRDFTFVDNVIHGNLLAANHPEQLAGETFNIACGNRISLRQLMAMLNEILGTNIQPNYTTARVGDILHSRADITKAQTILGYEPQVSFEEGLRKVARYLKRADSRFLRPQQEQSEQVNVSPSQST